jgi:hypothetical protein
MLPRLHGDADPAGEDLALLLAENWYPNLTHIDQITDKEEKMRWLLVTGALLRGQEAVTRYVEQFSKIFQPAVDAQVNDTIRKGAAEEQEREERKAREIAMHLAELARLAQQEDLDGKRWAMEEKERGRKLELDEEERKTKLRLEKKEREDDLKHKNRRQSIGLVMAIITFCCAFAAFIIGLASSENLVVGGSMITGITALITVVKLLNSNPQIRPPAPPDT